MFAGPQLTTAKTNVVWCQWNYRVVHGTAGEASLWPETIRELRNSASTAVLRSHVIVWETSPLQRILRSS